MPGKTALAHIEQALVTPVVQPPPVSRSVKIWRKKKDERISRERREARYQKDVRLFKVHSRPKGGVYTHLPFEYFVELDVVENKRLTLLALTASNFKLHSAKIWRGIDAITSSRVEDLFLLVAGVCTANSVTSSCVHILTYIKTYYTNVGMVQYVSQFVRIFFQELTSKPYDPTSVDEAFVVDDDSVHFGLHSAREGYDFKSFIDAFRAAKENWTVFKETDQFKHLMSIFSLIAAIGFIPSKFQMGNFDLDLFKIFKVKSLDFQADALNVFEAFVNTIFFFVSKGYELFSGSGEAILDNEVDKIDKEYAIIVGAEHLVNSGKLHLLDDKYDINIKSKYDYDARVKDLISKLQYYRKVEHNAHIRRVYDDKIIRLHKIMFELLRCQNENHFRECPYSFMISGSSSIGKSTLNSLLITAIAKKNDIDADEKYKVVINEQDKYDSDIQSHTTVITLDDFGNMRPDKVDDPPTRRIIDLINNMTKTAIKADVSEKGCISVNPKIISITTNTSDLHASHFSIEPVAIMRRLNVIIVPCLRATHTDKFGGLSSAAFAKDKDAWTFNVYKVKIKLSMQGNPMYRIPDTYEFDQLAKDISVYELIDLVNTDSFQHFAVQKQIVDSYRANVNNICPCCDYPTLVCRCSEEIKRAKDAAYNMSTHSARCNPSLISKLRNLYSLWKLMMIRWAVTLLLFATHLSVHKMPQWFDKPQHKTLVDLLNRSNMDAIRIANFYDMYSKFTFRSVYDKKWKKAAIACLGASFVATYYLYRRYRYMSDSLPQPTLQGAATSAPAEVNHWKKPEFVELPRSVSSVGITQEQLTSLIARSLAILRVCVGEKDCTTCNIIPLRGNYWLAPAHMFPEPKSYDINLSYGDSSILLPSYVGTIGVNQRSKIEDCDYVVVQLVFAGDQPNLLRFFAQDEFNVCDRALSCIYRDYRLKGCNNVCIDETLTTSQLMNMVIEGNKYRGCIYATSTTTFNGMCMGTFITKAHSPMIVGFHLAGDKKQGLMVPVSVKKILEAINTLSASGFDVHCSGTLDLNLYEIDYKFKKTIHFRSPVCYMGDKGTIPPNIKLYGSHELGRTSYNSAVVTTFISKDIERFMGVKNKHGPPPTHNLKLFWHADLDNIAHDSVYIDPEIFDLAVKDFRDFIGEATSKHDLSLCAPLSLDASVAGIDGRYGIDSLVLTTSMGFPLNCPKKKFIIPSEREVDGISRPLDLPYFLRTQLVEYENRYANGERCYPILKTTMKDEPTVIGKQKRRFFQASPCWFIILVRKYFLPLGAHIQKHRLDFCTAVGANAHGSDWNDITMHLMRFGSNKYIAGDYKAFDKHMPAYVLRAAGQAFIRMAHASGNYSDRDLFVMQGLLTDLIYPVLEYDGVIMSLTQSHCSGNSLTVLLNNFANMIYMRMAYYQLYSNMDEPPPFHHRVNLLVYGDDNVAEIHDDEKVFNHTSCSAALAYFNIEYTMADKEAASVPLISIHEINFLKRSFVFNTDLGVFVAPLELDSIFKSLHCMMRQRKMELCEREIVAGNIRSAFLEFWLHGKEYYDCNAPLLWNIVRLHALQTLVGPYKTYEEHIADYRFKYLSDDISAMGDESRCDDFQFELHSAASKIVRSHSCGGLSTVLVKRTKNFFLLVLLAILMFYYEHTIKYPNFNKCLCSTRSISHSENTTIVYSGKIKPQNFQLHSGREMFTMVNNTMKEQNITFDAAAPGYNAMVSDQISPDFETVSSDDNSIGNFLSRPTIIYERQLNVGASLAASVDFVNPWAAFLSQPPISNKVRNFHLIRGILHIKFELNASPFQYGKIMVTYQPYEQSGSGGIDRTDTDTQGNMVICSQRMKVFLNPSTSQGATMTLPFFYEREFIEINAFGTTNFGLLQFSSLSTFATTNDTVTPLRLTVYAYMTDVTLAMPSFFPQAAYETGIVSKPATAVAAAARTLGNVPLIGAYARATESIASGVAAISALFGFSKPSIVADETRVVPFITGNLATCNGADTSYKLTVDGKNELTIDPRIAGLSGKDEMSLVNLAGIESYLFDFPWDDRPPGALLASVEVSPTHYRYVPQSGKFFMTAACTAGLAFDYWKGSIKFRFIVNSSSLHRGRLKIVYEPNPTNIPFNPYLNTNYTHIVDLASTDDFTVCVGWGQSRMYQICRQPDENIPYSRSNTLQFTDIYLNGKIYVYVLNSLSTASGDDPNVDVSVFTSMCSDLDFAGPTTGKMNNFTPFPGSSQQLLLNQLEVGTERLDAEPIPLEVLEDIPKDPGELGATFQLHGANDDPMSADTPAEQPYDPAEVATMGTDCFVDQSNVIYFGEKITSIRTLFKRYNYITTESLIVGSNTAGRIVRWRMLGIPGADPNGMHLSTTGRYNYTRWSYINFYRLCFAGMRGAIRLKIAPVSPAVGDLTMSFAVSPTHADPANLLYPNTFNYSTYSRNMGFAMNDNGRGVAIGQTETKSVLEVELPYYRNRRFGPGGRTNQFLDQRENFAISFSQPGSTAPPAFIIYQAGGEDFTCYYWMGPPVLYTLSVSLPASGANPY